MDNERQTGQPKCRGRDDGKRVRRWSLTKGEADCDQERRKAGVEAEELHTGLAGDEQERECESDPEVREKENQNRR
jgi:hypothetical protein